MRPQDKGQRTSSLQGPRGVPQSRPPGSNRTIFYQETHTVRHRLRPSAPTAPSTSETPERGGRRWAAYVARRAFLATLVRRTGPEVVVSVYPEPPLWDRAARDARSRSRRRCIRCAPGGDVPLKNADYMYRVKYNKYATTSCDEHREHARCSAAVPERKPGRCRWRGPVTPWRFHGRCWVIPQRATLCNEPCC